MPLPVYCHIRGTRIESRLWSTDILPVFPLTPLILFALRFLLSCIRPISASLVSGAYFLFRLPRASFFHVSPVGCYIALYFTL